MQLRLSQGRAGQGRSLLARHSTGSVRGVQGRGTDMDWGESAPLLQEGDREQAGDSHWAGQGPAVLKVGEDTFGNSNLTHCGAPSKSAPLLPLARFWHLCKKYHTYVSRVCFSE